MTTQTEEEVQASVHHHLICMLNIMVLEENLVDRNRKGLKPSARQVLKKSKYPDSKNTNAE